MTRACTDEQLTSARSASQGQGSLFSRRVLRTRDRYGCARDDSSHGTRACRSRRSSPWAGRLRCCNFALLETARGAWRRPTPRALALRAFGKADRCGACSVACSSRDTGSTRVRASNAPGERLKRRRELHQVPRCQARQLQFCTRKIPCLIGCKARIPKLVKCWYQKPENSVKVGHGVRAFPPFRCPRTA